MLGPRRVVDDPRFGDTAVAIGRAMRGGQLIDIEGVPVFLRDVPGVDAQRRITSGLGATPGRPFTTEEIEAAEAAALVNKALNDRVLANLQTLYDSQDPRRMAGAALAGAAGGGLLAWLLKPQQGQIALAPEE